MTKIHLNNKKRKNSTDIIIIKAFHINEAMKAGTNWCQPAALAGELPQI